VLRKVVSIDEALCDGCGDCIPACAEGAIQVVDGKARLLGDLLCDGLGACLGTCEKGAIAIVEREGDAFDGAAVERHLAALERHNPPALPRRPAPACPGSAQREPPPPRRGLAVLEDRPAPAPARAPQGGSRLTQWPVQLHLVQAGAPYFRDAHLLVAADCVPFAYARFHDDFLAGKRLVVGCPKLDDVGAYVHKLADILRRGTIRSVTVVKMVVPCCGGIAAAARQALALAGADVPYAEVTVGVEGAVVASPARGPAA
jgi:NAD-dependent dihydropyrimidine dehydrogenase PreA subunit